MMDATMTAPKPKRKDRAVKIEEEIVVQALTMCSYRKTTVAEYLSGILRAPVAKDFAEFSRQLAEETKHPKRNQK